MKEVRADQVMALALERSLGNLVYMALRIQARMVAQKQATDIKLTHNTE